MKFNIQPQDLSQMIGRLRAFASSMNSISSQMRTYSGQLSSTWQDPQYMGFVDSVAEMSRMMQLSEQRLTQMAKQLEVLKQNLESTHTAYNRASKIR